ncbi:arsenic transporter [Alloacidobacterium dinghuense]|uniref:Arsenic transporter n=1 Tax=Alloacidobacterium dinghuense TaxID=2763107 RepID=A0A7G8BKH7_9BACT|nr:arsenic transporter [Alloacidobacterium dinghuense]QNI33047.1 arsenic transporter [Alloacidobacterium dinghuense]
MPLHLSAIWIISFLTIALMLLRPWRIPEAIWVCGGAGLLILFRLVPLNIARHAVFEGTDVYLFLAGMMILAQLGQAHGVFDWLATVAIQHAKASRARLFILIYVVGTVVTIFMSNDATAVVLTPAVLAAVKKAKTEPLPCLLSCAFIANAASFVLPISNPANLVVFHLGMPPLAQWLRMFAVASVLSIVTTFAALFWYCRESLRGETETNIGNGHLSQTGKLALMGIGLVAVVLLTASALGKDLGLPTFATSVVVVMAISARERRNPVAIIRGISWSVIPLVAGLFILVEAVNRAGAAHLSQAALHAVVNWPPVAAALATSLTIGVGTNLINNLPLGLIAGASVHQAHIVGSLRNAVLVGIDLGPNLSVTGSLATILWLIAIRKEGLHVSAWSFLKAGIIVMPSALLLATLAVCLTR